MPDKKSLKNTEEIFFSDEKSIRNFLEKLSDENYKKFAASLFKKPPKMLGVRLPILRKLAKNIPCSYLAYIPEFMEETMLQGMVIGNLTGDVKFILQEIEKFIPKINNWSICDSFCAGLKIAKYNRDIFFKFIKKYSFSKKEYELRFFFVMTLNYFILDDYIDEIFEILKTVKTDDYYAKIGAAWLVAECFIKFEEKTEHVFQKNLLQDEIKELAIRKILDSNKINKENKRKIKSRLKDKSA